MSDINRTIQIKYEAEVQNLVKGLTKVGNVSEKEAQKIINSLEKAYRKAEKDAAKAAQKQKKELEKVSRQANKTGKALTKSMKGAAAGFAIAGAAVLTFQQNIADLSNQLVDASAKTGIAVDTLAGLRLAAEGSGLSFENLEAGLIKLPSLMTDAAEKGGKAADAFKNIGVEVTETVNGFEKLRSADDVLKDIFHSLQDIESAEEKAAAAADLFGQRAGPAFVQSGAIDNLDAFMELANEFGVSTGPEMQKQMADFQRISSTALTVVQGEFSKLMDTAFGPNGMNEGIAKATELFIALRFVAQKQIEIMISGFSFLSGQITNFWDVLTGGDADKAMASNLENFQDLTDKFGSIGDMFTEINQRQTKFRESLQKTLDTPINRTGTITTTTDTESQKEALKMDKERLSLEKFALTLAKETKKEEINLMNLSAKRLEGEERELALLDAQLDAIELQRQEYIQRTNDVIFGLESVEGKEEELNKIHEEQQKRFIQFEKEKEAVTLERIDNIHAIRQEARDKKKKEDDDIRAQEEADHKKKMANIQEQMDAFAMVSGEFVNLGELSVQLFERFGEQNKKNAEIAFNVRKGIALSEIAINTAIGITRALALEGALGFVAAGAIGAAGAAQAVLVASEEPKFHMGGLVGSGSPLAPDERRITAQTGEAVLSTSAVRRLGGSEGIQAIERGQTSSPIVVVTNPFKHYDRFVKGRKLMGLDTNTTGRKGY